MSYIKRDLEHKFMETSKEYACLLITGSRQVGKTTMLRNLMEKERNYVTLDDLEERKLATTDPALFLQMHKPPVLIDEVQYAPQLFSYIKMDRREVDLVMESDGQLHPLEIKRSANPGSELVSAFKVLDKGSAPRSQGAIICLRKEFTAIDRENFVVPAWMI